MGLHHLIAVLITLLAGAPTAAQMNYFPPGTLDETAESSQFKEQWYAKHLQTLKEPSLWESSKTQMTQSYRFLWLRTFHHPISVRLDVNKDGTGLLTTRITTGKGGYEAGHLIKNKSQKLTKERTGWFLDRIEELGFWNLPTYEKSHEEIGPNGQKTVEIGLDGAQWILEGTRDGKYRVVDRWSPEKGPVRILGLIMLIDLAELRLFYQEVY